MSEFKVGQRIETTTHRKGIVKYVGPIHVADGTWLGIDLQEPQGKNDGSIREERYFSCPPQHGLFVKETDVLQILSQPAPKAAAPKVAPSKAKAPAPAPRSRPSSAVAPRPATSRPSSVTSPPAGARAPSHAKRQSVAPAAPRTPLRAPTRKLSVAGASTAAPSPPPTRPPITSKASTSSATPATTATQPQNPLRTSTRDSNVDALQTKIKHLEKQHSEDQARLKELSQAETERDKYQGIMQKLQAKLQTYHQEAKDAKAELENLLEENKRLLKEAQDHEFDLEDALLEREMAQERAEQNESELEGLRSKVEQQDLELEILKDEAEAYTAHMSEEDKEQAGYYRLQHENDRLRDALMLLKEVTEEEAHRSKARIDELEEDSSHLETLRAEYEQVQQRLTEAQGIAEHLKAQVNDRNELEDVVEEMSSRIQELESTVRDQESAISDLESLKELNEELLDQQDEEAKEMRLDFEAKEAELQQIGERALEQAMTISDLEETNTKFRDLVTELVSQIKEAESTKTMTEAQVKDTTGRINEVMDVNRRLRAAEVNATSKEITSELRQLKADQTTEMLEILSETQSQEFGRSEPMQAYFAAKRIMFKSNILNSLLANADKHASPKGGVEEASAKLLSLEASWYLANLRSGSDRIASAMAASSLQDFATFSSAHTELVAVERNLDQGLEALKADRVNFSEMATSFGGSIEVYKAVLATHQPVLRDRTADETLLRVSSIAASLTYLDSTCTATVTMLKSLAANNVDLAEDANDVIDRFAAPSTVCAKSMLAATRLLKTCSDRRGDGLYPQFGGDLGTMIQADTDLTKVAHDASKWSHDVVSRLSQSIDSDGTLVESVDLKDILLPFWSDHSGKLNSLIASLSSWNEYALMLKDCVEIHNGPAPWTEKAKEIEAARRQVDEAATKLQSITAEHQTTLLKLHEREQIIETKDLEIEHLAAKNRDATTKSEDVSRLQSEVEEARAELKQLQKQDKAQKQELDDLNIKLAQAALNEPAETDKAPAVVTPGPDPADAARSAPASLMSLLDALQAENRFLRQKNAGAYFGASQIDMLKSMRVPEKRERSKLSAATENLLSLAWLSDDAAQPEVLSSISASDPQEQKENDVSTPKTRRAKRAPLALQPLTTQLDTLKTKGRLDWSGFGLDDLGFADLSPTLEFFDSEILSLKPLTSIVV